MARQILGMPQKRIWELLIIGLVVAVALPLIDGVIPDLINLWIVTLGTVLSAAISVFIGGYISKLLIK